MTNQNRQLSDVKSELDNMIRLQDAPKKEQKEFLGFLITKASESVPLSFIERQTLFILAKKLEIVK